MLGHELVPLIVIVTLAALAVATGTSPAGDYVGALTELLVAFLQRGLR